MKLFTWLELGMVVYGFIRILANFSPRAVLPRDDPSDLGVFIFSIYIVLGVFRYLSYLGIRITWINPSDPTPNTLNKPLAQAIKEKDQLLQGLIASNRVIGISALASSLAHQLSQPLTTIALRADTTRRDLVQSGQDPKIIASIDEIATQSLRLTALVKNLRQFFDSNSSDHVPTNLQNKIDEILEIVEPQLQSNKIILLKEYKSNPIVFGDGIQIQQALINVINNSIDALVLSQDSPKKISISLTSNQSQATITVRDNGGGIDSELLPTIFDLYKSTKKDGLGVGLWLSKTILANHQGGIAVKNDPIGGDAFTITLPIHQDSGQ
jgi:C4-dicarboxylate-specific signal transduction histidine kinase